MTRNQFIDLRIGDVVVITLHGKNKGKFGSVNDIVRGPGKIGLVHLSPVNCQFELASRSKRRLQNGDWVFRKNEIKINF